MALFGESPSRIVVTVRPDRLAELLALAAEHGVATSELGRTGGERLFLELRGEGATGAAEERGSAIADDVDVAIVDLAHAHERGLPRALGLEPTPES